MTKKIISVLGAGSFGTTMAHVLSQGGNEVRLWAREEEIAREINAKRTNSTYLPGLNLGPVTASSQMEAVLEGASFVFLSIPTSYLRDVINRHQHLIPQEAYLVNTAKGIEQQSLLTPSGVLAEVLGPEIQDRFVVLSGPTFAKELAEGQPTGAVVASKNKSAALAVRQAFPLKTFRLYSAADVIGVELGGALKNVMAIGIGIAEGLGFGMNTRAGFMTRCLFDMTRLGVAMGANALTFSGLSGVGDLILTCTGALSRNRSVGFKLGQGSKIADILAESRQVAEGVATAKSAHLLSEKYGLDMPNADFVYRVLYEGLNPKDGIKVLLSRELKDELQGLDPCP